MGRGVKLALVEGATGGFAVLEFIGVIGGLTGLRITAPAAAGAWLNGGAGCQQGEEGNGRKGLWDG